MSNPVVVNVPHQLGREEARRRLQEGFGRIREQAFSQALNFQENWEGDQLHFKASTLGQKVSGRIEVFESNVRIEVDLPWFLAALAGPLGGRLQSEGKLLLEKA